jgi:hypothetical protein
MKSSTYILKQGVLIVGTLMMLSASAFAQNSSDSSQLKLSDRVATRKNSLNLQLSAAQSQKITKNCVAAQSILKNIAKDKTALDNRQEVYADLSTRVTTTLRLLQLQKVDIEDLKNIQTQFDRTINQYIADASTYQESVNDAIAIDCLSDPVGFDATLVSARQLRVRLTDDTSKIKAARSLLVQALKNKADVLSKTTVGVSQ